MKKIFLLVLLLALAFQQLLGQAKLRKLPPNINHTSVNNFAPCISLDGNTLIYVSDAAEDNALVITYSIRDGVNWRDPVVMPKSINSRLNFLNGFGVSPDGKTLYISNSKGNGIGGFDLYTSQFNGVMWTDPVNLSIPINSKSHEASPSLTSDGSTMFFMRCEKMDFAKAENCKLMVVNKKPNGQWGEPMELPAFINTGNSQTPRIMGDGETLIFSSNQLKPNKGGMDLYLTRLANGAWGPPIPLDFINTATDDQFVSATSLGRYILRDVKGTRENELIEMLIPEDIRPKGTIKVDGIVSGVPDLSSPYITVYNLQTQSRISSIKPGKDGTFVAYLKEGGYYDISVDPQQDNYTFFSKQFDTANDKFSQVEKIAASIKPLEAGDEVFLDGVTFNAFSADISSASSQELRRLVRLLQGNAGKYFSFEVTMNGYLQDSIKNSPDLTEIKRDTMKIPITFKVDSITTSTRDSIIVKTNYHNDRTPRQAKAICQYLISAGIPAGKLACSGKALPEAIPENRKTKVTLIVH